MSIRNSQGLTKEQMNAKYPNKSRYPDCIGDVLDGDPLTDRRCRKCKDFLPASKYFYHIWCVPDLNQYGPGDYGIEFNLPALRERKSVR